MKKIMESVGYGKYTFLETVMVEESSKYYLLPPPYKIAIPFCPTAYDTFTTLANKLGAWDLPSSIEELPTCNSRVVKEILLDYTIIPVLKNILHVAPVKVLSPMEEEAIRDAKRRQSIEGNKKTYITGELVLD